MEVTYTDHDLLVLLYERSKVQADAIDALKAGLHEDLNALRNRLTDAERQLDKQSGFFSGAKFVWSLIGALPPTAILLIFGAQQ